jgi:WD40 repeat protein
VVCVICLSGDGRLLAAGLEDGSIELWDVDKHSVIVTLRWVRLMGV